MERLVDLAEQCEQVRIDPIFKHQLPLRPPLSSTTKLRYEHKMIREREKWKNTKIKELKGIDNEAAKKVPGSNKHMQATGKTIDSELKSLGAIEVKHRAMMRDQKKQKDAVEGIWI